MRVGGNHAVGAFGDLAPEIEHHAAVRDAFDNAHLMLDNDDGEVLVTPTDQQDVVHQFGGFLVRHAGRRLVEQQQLWRADERTAYLYAATVDHRQSGDRFEQAIGKRRLEDLDETARGGVTLFELALEIAALGQVKP